LIVFGLVCFYCFDGGIIMYDVVVVSVFGCYVVVGVGVVGLVVIVVFIDVGYEVVGYECIDCVGGYWYIDYEVLHLIMLSGFLGFDGYLMLSYYFVFFSCD